VEQDIVGAIEIYQLQYTVKAEDLARIIQMM
jgi:hypothetical protein